MEVKIVELLSGLEEESWRMRSKCGPENADLFFPPTYLPTSVRQETEAAAKRICAECPVRGECLEDSLARSNESGIWGGMNEKERNQLRKSIGRTADR